MSFLTCPCIPLQFWLLIPLVNNSSYYFLQSKMICHPPYEVFFNKAIHSLSYFASLLNRIVICICQLNNISPYLCTFLYFLPFILCQQCLIELLAYDRNLYCFFFFKLSVTFSFLLFSALLFIFNFFYFCFLSHNNILIVEN